jgi:hypothetical protein
MPLGFNTGVSMTVAVTMHDAVDPAPVGIDRNHVNV